MTCLVVFAQETHRGIGLCRLYSSYMSVHICPCFAFPFLTCVLLFLPPPLRHCFGIHSTPHGSTFPPLHLIGRQQVSSQQLLAERKRAPWVVLAVRETLNLPPSSHTAAHLKMWSKHWLLSWKWCCFLATEGNRWSADWVIPSQGSQSLW